MRVRRAHFFRQTLGGLNIDEFTLADARAPGSRLVPRLAVVDQFGPVREASTLHGLGQMNPAAAAFEELALRMSGHAQAAQIFRPVDVAALEFRVGHAQICGESREVFFGQIDEPLLLAASGAAGLALESHENAAVAACPNSFF